jgi:hypothetical protein
MGTGIPSDPDEQAKAIFLEAIDRSVLTAEWGGADGYLQRVQDLFGNGSGGLNGSYLLNAETVVRDRAISQLFGRQGSDWFRIGEAARSADKINGYTTGEVAMFD